MVASLQLLTQGPGVLVAGRSPQLLNEAGGLGLLQAEGLGKTVAGRSLQLPTVGPGVAGRWYSLLAKGPEVLAAGKLTEALVGRWWRWLLVAMGVVAGRC